MSQSVWTVGYARLMLGEPDEDGHREFWAHTWSIGKVSHSTKEKATDYAEMSADGMIQGIISSLAEELKGKVEITTPEWDDRGVFGAELSFKLRGSDHPDEVEVHSWMVQETVLDATVEEVTEMKRQLALAAEESGRMH